MKYRCRICGVTFHDAPLATARELAFQHSRYRHPKNAPNQIIAEIWQ